MSQSELSRDELERALGAFVEPCSGKTLAELGALRSVSVDGGQPRVELELGFPAHEYAAKLQDALQAALGLPALNLTVHSKIVAHAVQRGTRPVPGVSNIIAVASGKGGVGKSTVAVNLALALEREGAQVGLLDADIYGPSQPRMLGCPGKPETDGKQFEPKRSYNIQTISIGHLIDEETPMIWRGPMVTGALEQLLNQTNWQALDYLIVDLPPGTGDIQLTLCQKIPVSGAVIVTTPQDIALLDARKGLKMFEKVDVPVLGIVENMSVHVCSQCGHAEHIFGEGGGAAMASQYGVDLLGSLPLDMRIREGVDNGRPTVAMDADSAAAAAFMDVARRMTARLALRGRNYAARFPNIVVKDS